MKGPKSLVFLLQNGSWSSGRWADVVDKLSKADFGTACDASNFVACGKRSVITVLWSMRDALLWAIGLYNYYLIHAVLTVDIQLIRKNEHHANKVRATNSSSVA